MLLARFLTQNVTVYEISHWLTWLLMLGFVYIDGLLEGSNQECKCMDILDLVLISSLAWSSYLLSFDLSFIWWIIVFVSLVFTDKGFGGEEPAHGLHLGIYVPARAQFQDT